MIEQKKTKDNEYTPGEIEDLYPEKFVSTDVVFKFIRPGARIFIGTGCGEPQYLTQALIKYVESHPKAFFDAELIHVVALGVAPYTDYRFQANFRCNAFFIGGNLRQGVNHGLADYTPVFLSEVPKLLGEGQLPIDMALIQTSPPDKHGNMSLGVSVDIVKAAIENADRTFSAGITTMGVGVGALAVAWKGPGKATAN